MKSHLGPHNLKCTNQSLEEAKSKEKEKALKQAGTMMKMKKKMIIMTQQFIKTTNLRRNKIHKINSLARVIVMTDLNLTRKTKFRN